MIISPLIRRTYLLSHYSNNLEIRKGIFDENVRIYLKKSNKINKQIIESATSKSNSKFWYLNNGITLTCDDFSYPTGIRNPNIEMSNIQIVNGGQTSNALFEANKDHSDKINDVLLLVRIIATKSKNMSYAVAVSSNSQTPIKSRDLKSNDVIQRKMEVAFRGIGYFYERKLKQYETEAREKRLDSQDLGQCRLAYELEKPEVANKDKGRMYGDLYDEVFADDLNPIKLLCAYKLNKILQQRKRKVQQAIRKEENLNPNELFLINGVYHVLFSISKICIKKGLDMYNFETAKELIEEAIEIVSHIVNEAQSREGESFSNSRFFKESKTANRIEIYLDSHYQ